MKKILAGYLKFKEDILPQHRRTFEDLAVGQTPEVLFITCSDSRILPNLFTQTKPGDLFIIRNAGNIVPPFGDLTGAAATIEYAVLALNVRHIIVCGHSDCGVMKGVMHPEKLGQMPRVAAWIQSADSARMIAQETHPHQQGHELLHTLTRENVLAQLHNLETHPSVAARLRNGKVQLHGWVYDIPSGEIDVVNPETGRWERLSDIARAQGIQPAEEEMTIPSY
jgi:carbonic anhydrase